MINERPHKKLTLWVESMELVTSVYELTKKFPKEEEFGSALQSPYIMPTAFRFFA